MNDLLAMLGQMFGAIEGFFAHARVLSLLIGIGAGIGLTQLAKFPLYRGLVKAPPKTLERLNEEHQLRWWVRLVAIATTAIPTYFTWPGDFALWVALANGAVCPFTYLLIKYAIGRWVPGLSVTRRPDDPPVQ